MPLSNSTFAILILFPILIAPLNTADAAVGQTEGQAGVSPTGEATYTIPIKLPPGINNLTPELALTYNHQRGESLAGVGWGLTGLSAITRCVKTVAQDGVFDAVNLETDDRYCLDGNQLRLVSGSYGAAGSSYRTEIDLVARVTANGSAGEGPSSFKVESKDGLIYEYGYTNDSRIESIALGKTDTARLWALNKIRDRSGNEIEIFYQEDGAPYGTYRPVTIEYRSNPSALGAIPYRISLTYETQPALDIDTSYATDGLVEDIKRLKKIEIGHLSGLTYATTRSYEISYESNLSVADRSRISSIKECGTSTSDCLRPISFTYQNGVDWLIGESPSGSTIPTNTKPLAIDINGDGRTDVAYPSAASGGKWMYRLANSSGGYYAAVNSGINSTNHAEAIVTDHNSDGLDDILVPYSGSTWWAIRGTPSGLSWPVNTQAPDVSTAGNATSFDVNGDGRDDLVWAENVGVGYYNGKVNVRYRNTSGNGYGSVVNLFTGNYYSRLVGPALFDSISQEHGRNFDINGDGHRDISILKYFPGAYGASATYFIDFILGNNQQLLQSITLGSSGSINGRPIDLNGDGYTDISYQSGSTYYTRISTGIGFGSQISVSASTALYDWDNAVVMDWSGDGMEDLLVRNTSNNELYVAESDGFSLRPPTRTWLYVGIPKHTFATDSNGDGLHDVAYVKSNNSYVHRTHYVPKPDLLIEVLDGYGVKAKFHYASLTDSSIYTKGTGATLPTYEFLEPITVVKTLEQTNNGGSTFDLDYTYEGAKANIDGRGLGGFTKRTYTDSRTGNKIIETYRTDFPYQGRIKKRELRLANTTLIQEITHTWAKKTAGSGFQNYHFPYISSSTEKNFELDGGQINTITTTSLVDNYGTPYDVTRVSTEHSNAHGAMPGASFTQRTYTPTSQLHNGTSNWCIGKRKQIQRINSHSSTYGGTITRRTDYTWDTSSKCRVTRTIVEPGSAKYKVTTDFEYDIFGNIDKETVTGVGMSPRVTQIDWGTNGQFPVSITNPLSQVTTLAWDYDTGDLLSTTDPNNLTASWQYDSFNRVIQSTRPDGTYTTYTFADCVAYGYCGTGHSPVRTHIQAIHKTAAGVEVRRDDVFRDLLGRTIQTHSDVLGGAISKTRTSYDTMGRVRLRSAPSFSTAQLKYVEILYDVLDRPTRYSRHVHDATSSKQYSYVYYNGLQVTTKDAEGNQTWKIHDVLGRVHQSHDNLAHYQQFDYDAFGAARKVRDCISSTCTTLTEMTYEYGAEAFKVSSDDMSLGLWHYSYNALGEMSAYNDAKTGGSLPSTATATFTYDKLGRPLTRTEPEGTTSWTWGVAASSHNIGRLHSVTSPGHSQQFWYDSKGRLAKHRRVGGGTYDFDYVYDSNTGLLSSIQYPASSGGYRFKVLHEYDHGILKRVKRSDSGQTVYWEAQTQDAFGNVIDEDFGNGSSTVRGFDGVTGRLDYIDTFKGSTQLQDLSYSWDKVGNLLSRTDLMRSGTPTEAFMYDSLNRLTDADVSGAASTNLDLTFDPNGNIKNKDDVSSSNWTYHSTNKHAVVTAGSNSYAYDANGNMTSRKGDSIVWTSYNYPSELNEANRTFEYSYDADRQKWKQIYTINGSSETTYFAGRRFEKNLNSNGTDYRHYVIANGRAVAMFVDKTSGSDFTRYFLHDHLGSQDGIVEDNGTTIQVSDSFSAYGERRDPTDWVGDTSQSNKVKLADTTDRGYTDHVNMINTSLIHMNGRVYDAEIGRFLSPDPHVANPMSTQGFNRYAYVENNPMRYTDPSGFCIDGYSCVIEFLFGTALNFLFGGGGDDLPKQPHNFCKDNTAGCGGAALSALNSYMPSPPKLPGKPRVGPCLFCKGGGILGVSINFGGHGTGNPLVLWSTGDENIWEDRFAEVDKFAGISEAEFLDYINDIREQLLLLTSQRTAAESGAQTGPGAGGFINNRRPGPLARLFGATDEVVFSTNPGNSNLRPEVVEQKFANSRYTIAGVAVLQNSTISRRDLADYFSIAADLQAPLIIYTTEREFNGGTRMWIYSIIGGFKVTADPGGYNPKCTNLTTGGEC